MHAVHTHIEPARLAASPEDYARFGLTKGHVEPWEDGLRLDPGAPNIEWWYSTRCWTMVRYPGGYLRFTGPVTPGSLLRRAGSWSTTRSSDPLRSATGSA